MKQCGSTGEHFAKIGYKNHKHSVNNPYAQFQEAYSLDDILTSRMIYDPLTKLQCSPTSDGSGAAILASEAFVDVAYSRNQIGGHDRLELGDFAAEGPIRAAGDPQFYCGNEHRTLVKVPQQVEHLSNRILGDRQIGDISGDRRRTFRSKVLQRGDHESFLEPKWCTCAPRVTPAISATRGVVVPV
jgi:hypothetical protein